VFMACRIDQEESPATTVGGHVQLHVHQAVEPSTSLLQ
jgi:hypothetical protein